MSFRLPTGALRAALSMPDIRLLLTVAFCSGFATGLFAPLLSIHMKLQGHGDVVIGWVGTLYYAGVALGAVGFGTGRLGIKAALVLGLSVASVSGLLLPFLSTIAALAWVRVLSGISVGVYEASGQLALLELTTDSDRGLFTGLYAFAFTLALSLGPWLGSQLYDRSQLSAFVLGSAVLLATTVFVLRSRIGRSHPPQQSAAVGGVRALILPLHAAFCFGFAEAALLSVYPVACLRRQLSVETIGTSCAVFVIGSIAGMLPVTVAGDRWGRRRVLLAVVAFGGVALALLARAEEAQAVAALSFIVGATIGPLFALALALMRDLQQGGSATTGSAAFLASFSAGCVAGPILSSATMSALGVTQVFLPTLLLLTLLVVHAANSTGRRD